MAPMQEPVSVPRPRKLVTFGLIVLAIFMPWFALYLDGASWQTVGLNFAAWILVPVIGTALAIVHAIICLCRSSEHRKYSNPARRRLRYDNNYSAGIQVHAEKKIVDSEPEAKPALVQRVVTEPAPTPVEKAPTALSTAKSSATSSATSVSEHPPPAPIKKAATEPPARKSSVTSSSSSVSSNAEKENSPANEPPPRTATAKKDDPFKDPGA